MNTWKKTLQRIENTTTPLYKYYITILAIIILRIVLENFSDTNPILSLTVITHFTLFYTSLLITLILITHYISKKTLPQLIKTATYGFGIILLAPLLDLLISGKADMAYIMPGYHNNLLNSLITFGGTLSTPGITLGIRIETGIILIGILLYLYTTTKNVLKSILGTLASYLLIFFYAITPFIIIELSQIVRATPLFEDITFIKYYILLLGIQFVILYARSNKTMFDVIRRDLRLSRILFYAATILTGALLATRQELTTNDLFNYVLAAYALFTAAIYSIITNNTEDRQLDEKTNRSYLKAPPEIYAKQATQFLTLTAIFSLAINATAFLFYLALISSYYLYSMKPYRLKRALIISKLFIGINTYLAAMIGYSLITHHINGFPHAQALPLLILVTINANFIDLKDHQADKKHGIRTLPVMLGMRRTKWLMAITFLLTYYYVAHLLNNYYLIILGIPQAFFFIKKKYQEKYVLYWMLFSIVIAVIQALL